MVHALGESRLSIPAVIAVARDRCRVEISEGARTAVQHTRRVVEQAAASERPFYAINTGVGSLANTRLPPDRQVAFQAGLIRAHAAGVGHPIASEVVRAAMLLRAESLAKGLSGVTIGVIERIVRVLNSTYTPVVPEIGSLGCSGDLAQLAHLAAVLFLREGFVTDGAGQILPAAAMHHELGLAPITLGPKEGPSLINGTEFMSGSLCLTVHDATTLLATADLAAGLSRAAFLAYPDAVGEFAQSLRPHAGQGISATNMRELMPEETQLTACRAAVDVFEPQDPYSIRCSPQVHGAVAGVLSHVRSVVDTEINSCTDNPSVDIRSDPMRVISHGNFHGAPLAYAADYLKISLADLASLAERRVSRLIDEKLSRGLDPYLVHASGENSGFMIAHYTMAALVNRMRTRAPNSTDSIPTSAGWEDHVSMGWNACAAAHESVSDLAKALAVELMAAAQALTSRREAMFARGLRLDIPDQLAAAVESIHEVSPPVDEDRILGEEIGAVARAAVSGSFAPPTFRDRYRGL